MKTHSYSILAVGVSVLFLTVLPESQAVEQLAPQRSDQIPVSNTEPASAPAANGVYGQVPVATPVEPPPSEWIEEIDGTVTVFDPDGTTITTSSDGSATTAYPGGTITLPGGVEVPVAGTTVLNSGGTLDVPEIESPFPPAPDPETYPDRDFPLGNIPVTNNPNGTQTLPNGGTVYPNGGTVYPDGGTVTFPPSPGRTTGGRTLPLPDGTVVVGGTIYRPTGRPIPLPAGTVEEGGTVYLPGTVVLADGTVIYPEGYEPPFLPIAG